MNQWLQPCHLDCPAADYVKDSAVERTWATGTGILDKKLQKTDDDYLLAWQWCGRINDGRCRNRIASCY
jgi:hypothetical protein